MVIKVLTVLRRRMNEQRENFNRDGKYKKVPKEIIEPKNTVTVLKIHSRGSTAGYMKQKKGSVNSNTGQLEPTQSEQQKENKNEEG